MPKIHQLKGIVQHYAWGGSSFIPDLLNIPTDDQPCAEYWLGSHGRATSTLKIEDSEKNFNAYLDEHLEELLGQKVAATFGHLPFLFKVLDVKDMLSIQVHPTKTEAEKGFAKENDLGIPLDAPHRNYKDDNHKPEIMVTLSEFWLIHGFLPEQKIKQVLEQTPEFEELIDVFAKDGYYGLYKMVMEFSNEECNQRLRPMIDRILPLYEKGELQKSSPDYWAAKSVSSFGDPQFLDRGIYSIYFFNLLRLKPGEAIFQDAGIPHAYLEGQNIELMANSDNVLRGGLTPKHVDVPELLKHVVFEATHPNVMKGELQTDGLERIYHSPAPDFELSKINLEKKDVFQSTAQTGQILMVLQGEVSFLEGNQMTTLHKGESVFISAVCNYQIRTPSEATIYKATAPSY